MCRSCRGTLRSTPELLRSPPYDLCVARLGKQQYWNSITNEWCVPSKETNSHYCARMACIQFSFPTFVPTSLVVPEDVSSRLHTVHKNYLSKEFGLLLKISIQYAAFIHYSIIHYLQFIIAWVGQVYKD